MPEHPPAACELLFFDCGSVPVDSERLRHGAPAHSMDELAAPLAAS